MSYKQLLYIILLGSFSQANNVCKHHRDYWVRLWGCHYNPEQNIEIWDIIKRHGYPLEIYHLTTDDGYNLQMFRIPNATGTPVILMHGIYMSSIVFVNIGEKSLAFLLSNAGFDVWLVNFRGTRYSLTHQVYATDSNEYWDFSWHEMAKYDTKSVTDLVWNTTNKQSIVIGFSLGSTVSYVYNILYPDEALVKWKHVVSLASIVYLKHARASLVKIRFLWHGLKPATEHLQHGVVFRRSKQSIHFLNNTCLQTPPQMTACLTEMQSVFGFDWDQINYERYPVNALQNPDSISTKTVDHYYQNIEADDFRLYDNGEELNLILYNRNNAPSYNISKINVNMTLYCAENDYLSTIPDNLRFYNKLEVLNKTLIINKYRKFSHMDYIEAKDVDKLLYNDVVERLQSL